jgi:hypothetical protein
MRVLLKTLTSSQDSIPEAIGFKMNPTVDVTPEDVELVKKRFDRFSRKPLTESEAITIVKALKQDRRWMSWRKLLQEDRS